MKVDPWTLAFQLLNFAVLLLVLFRLLFKPLQRVMAERAAQVQGSLDAAAAARAEAEKLREGLALEQERVGKQRAEMLEGARREVEEHRQRRLAAVDAEAEARLERGRALLEAERRKADEQLHEQALGLATDYAAALLGDLADEQVHRALLRRLPEAFAQGAGDLAAAAPDGEGVRLEVQSALALAPEEAQGLRGLVGERVPVSDLVVAVEPRLLAGVRLRFADRVFDFSLRGQIDALAAALEARR